MLRERLAECKIQRSEVSLQEFMRSMAMQPIAVATDKANEQHYEVPTSYFQRVLGPHLKYSCCYWDDGVETLDQAEDCALQRTSDNADIENGMRILELGCGWGSLSLWMAERYRDSRITAVSNSRSQREYIESQASARNIDNLSVVTADVNNFVPSSQFDRVVSVEMLEHVRNHANLFDRINKWLHPGGKLFVHVFCHKDTPYLFQSYGENNWMGRFFFSGGMMPSFDLLPNINTSLRLEQSWQWNGTHYAKTCRSWLRRHDQSADLLSVLSETYGSQVAEIWSQRWRMFFMACEELFAYNGGEEWFVAQYRFAQKG